MAVNSAEDLFTNELREIYSAEQQLSRVLPRLSKAVHTDSVRQCFDERVQQGQKLLQSIDNDAVEGLIGAVQKIEHYCIASWGTAAALGRALGRQPAVQAFEQALQEGKQFDKSMTELAENEINPAAIKASKGGQSGGARAQH